MTRVDAIRRAFGAFQALDVARGGGHARARLTAYLGRRVVPLLKDADSALFEVVAEQLYLVGWMAFDDGAPTSARRLLSRSLLLAHTAGNPDLRAHVLAGLADLSISTGRPDHGRRFAQAGIESGRSHACLARLWARQGRAEAAMSDGKAAVRSVRRSEVAFEAVRGDEPEWARFIDSAYLHGEYAHTFRDLGRPEETARFARLSIAEAERQNRARRGRWLRPRWLGRTSIGTTSRPLRRPGSKPLRLPPPSGRRGRWRR